MPKLGVDAVRGNDEIAFGHGSVRERHPGHVADLLKAGASMSGMHHLARQGRGQHLDEVGAVHPECCVPARGVRHLDRRDRRPVMAEVLRTGPDPGSLLLYRRSEAHPLQLAHAVRRQEHAGADLAKAGGLLIDRHTETMSDQRVGGEQPADPAANDHHVRPSF